MIHCTLVSPSWHQLPPNFQYFFLNTGGPKAQYVKQLATHSTVRVVIDISWNEKGRESFGKKFGWERIDCELLLPENTSW